MGALARNRCQTGYRTRGSKCHSLGKKKLFLDSVLCPSQRGKIQSGIKRRCPLACPRAPFFVCAHLFFVYAPHCSDSSMSCFPMDSRLSAVNLEPWALVHSTRRRETRRNVTRRHDKTRDRLSEARGAWSGAIGVLRNALRWGRNFSEEFSVPYLLSLPFLLEKSLHRNVEQRRD